MAHPAATTAVRTSRTQDRVLWLDGLRGAAAMFVVLHHMWLDTWPTFPINTGPWWLGWLLYGHMAVAVFIVVSGFSLALVPLSNGGRLGGIRRFVRRRAWRILPAYWAALIVSMVVTVVVLRPDLGPAAAAKSFAVHALLLQDAVGSVTPNGALWSIAVEWQIYFVFPLILLVSRRTSVATAALTTTVAVLIAHAIARLGSPLDKIDHLTPQFLALFALGVLALHLGRGDHAERLRRPLLAVALASLAIFVGCALTQGSAWVVAHFFFVDLIFGLAVACMLAVMYSGGIGPARRALGSRTGLWLGLFSYSIYLVHDPIVGVLHHYVVGPMNLPPLASFGVFVAVGIPVVLGVCYGFHVLFEAPFLRRRNWSALRELAILRPDAWRLPGRSTLAEVARVRVRLPAWATARRGRE
jgi:peptidoglycan/LPS O-acetylase OafA/YrhL